MPVGRYTVMDGDGRPVGTEEFRCAPGPAGWRYASSIRTTDPEPHGELVDFVVDASWRPVRLRIDTESHQLQLAPRSDRLVGVRDGQPVDEPFGPEVEIDYLSPCFNAVTARRLGRTAEIDVVYLEPVTCVPVRRRQRYELLGEDRVQTPVGAFDAVAWRYSELDSDVSNTFWAAGEIVVAYEGLFELAEYDPGPRGPFPA
ncbi:MAG TPA: putative glycolipid-binding domain-containing protein [Actinomycetota bacterium]|nr:putative glycolipid-binding domain-containing protein [Actinomycetota bacterium]